MFRKDFKTNRERKKIKQISRKNFTIYSNKHVRIKNKLINKTTVTK